MLINKKNVLNYLAFVLIVMPCHIYAQENDNQLSYSADQWPTRWTNAIQQQQAGKFPARTYAQTTFSELPSGLSENELFYSPQRGTRYGHQRGEHQHNDGYINQHFSRASATNNGRTLRDASYAYQNRFRRDSMNYMRQGYNHPYALPMPTMYPMNIPTYGTMPFGYPGFMGMWNPLVNSW